MKASKLTVFICCIAVLSASCARPPAPPAPAPVHIPVVPAPIPPAPPRLPPVPEVRGPLQINVVYPKPEQMLTARDSNFIFGSVGTGDAALEINGVPVPVWPNGSFMGWLPVPSGASPQYLLVAANKTEKSSLVLPIKLPPPPDTVRKDNLVGDTLNVPAPSADTVLPVTTSVYVTLGAPASTVNDTDRVTIARPAPGNGQEYKWFLFPGTVVKATGARKASGDDFVRIQLDSSQEAWVLRSEIQTQNLAVAPATGFIGDSIAPRRRIGTVRLESAPEWMDIVIPMTGPPPAYLVEEGDRFISVLVYGVDSPSVVSMMPQARDSYVNSVNSTPEPSRVRYTINLNRAPYGYLALWQNGTLTFRVRRPPQIADAANPLRGLTITVDPGHPPAGATGPTGLYEGDAVLQVGLKLRDMLVQRGVNVVMTRTTPEPVDLGLRPIISRRANAHAFVSIHLNAFPDGVNPFANNGSATYYFWQHSVPFAAQVHANLVEQLGLRGAGTPYVGMRFGNLAVVRGTWMPSILTEGAFVIMPDQEAALRTPTYLEFYATAILRGLESYFASLAQKR